MEPITLVDPVTGYRVVVTVSVEEHRLRSLGYREPKPEPVVEEPQPEPKPEPEKEPEPEVVPDPDPEPDVKPVKPDVKVNRK